MDMENIGLENEIVQIQQLLESKKAQLKEGGNVVEKSNEISEKEIIRDVIGQRIKFFRNQSSQTETESESKSNISPVPPVESPAYLSPELKDKVQELVNICFTDSIEQAVKQAKALDNPALIDALHDALIDEVHAALIERGKLQKVV